MGSVSNGDVIAANGMAVAFKEKGRSREEEYGKSDEWVLCYGQIRIKNAMVLSQ